MDCTQKYMDAQLCASEVEKFYKKWGISYLFI